MADEKIYIGDVGTTIEVDMQESLVGFSGFKFLVKKPKADGSGDELKTWTAVTKSGVGNEKLLVHVTVAGEVDAPGHYYIQPYGEVTGWKGRGDTFILKVLPVFGIDA